MYMRVKGFLVGFPAKSTPYYVKYRRSDSKKFEVILAIMDLSTRLIHPCDLRYHISRPLQLANLALTLVEPDCLQSSAWPLVDLRW